MDLHEPIFLHKTSGGVWETFPVVDFLRSVGKTFATSLENPSLWTSRWMWGYTSKFHCIGGSRDSSTRKTIRYANHSFCGQNGSTRIMEILRESITLDNICLRTANGGNAQMLRSSHWCWEASSFHTIQFGMGEVNGELCMCPSGKQIYVRVTKFLAYVDEQSWKKRALCGRI